MPADWPLCYRDDPFKWIRGGVNVNHHTLGDFRVQHAAWLEEQVIQLVAVIEEHQGQLPGEYDTDGGFSTKDDIEKVGQRGVTVFTPVKEEKKRLEKGQDPFAP